MSDLPLRPMLRFPVVTLHCPLCGFAIREPDYRGEEPVVIDCAACEAVTQILLLKSADV